MSRNKHPVPQQSFLEELAGLWPLAKGSLAEVHKPCIRPNCRACKEGRKHRAFLFTFTLDGKRRCRYVPLGLVETMRKALTNGRRLEKRLFELGGELIEDHRKNRT
jgi:hypothetical protein